MPWYERSARLWEIFDHTCLIEGFEALISAKNTHLWKLIRHKNYTWQNWHKTWKTTFAYKMCYDSRIWELLKRMLTSTHTYSPSSIEPVTWSFFYSSKPNTWKLLWHNKLLWIPWAHVFFYLRLSINTSSTGSFSLTIFSFLFLAIENGLFISQLILCIAKNWSEKVAWFCLVFGLNHRLPYDQ